MGRSLLPERSSLDRGEPKPHPSGKKRRLSDGGAGAGRSNGLAVQKAKASTGPALSCPAAVTRALARAVEARQRTLCVLLSDAPDAGTYGWMGDDGR